ncbi:pathogenicity island 2 effector protein SseF, partial [Salmonella enterica subsp. enterica serovar Wilhelmsburg]
MKIHIPSAASNIVDGNSPPSDIPVADTHLRAHETELPLGC